MSADDFKTGTRVCFDDDSSKLGIVIDDDAKRAEYPGFVPVRWDNGDRTMSRAVRLIPINSRSATPQAGRGQTAGTPTSPQGVPAPTQPHIGVDVGARGPVHPLQTTAAMETNRRLARIENLLVGIRNLLADQAAPKLIRIVQKGDVVGRIGGKRSSTGEHLHFENGARQ